MAPKWIQNQRNALNRVVNKFNKNLTPLGVRVKKYGPDSFGVEYGNSSNIRVTTRPDLLTGSLAGGGTHPNNRKKGIATALRTFATAILRNAGFVKVRHQGVFVSNTNLNKTGGVPITTHVVRKHLGFVPVKGSNANGNYRSVWTPNRYPKKLKNAEQTARNRLASLRK